MSNNLRFLLDQGEHRQAKTPMRNAYFLYKGGHQRGPFRLGQLQAMLQAHAINATDQIRRADEPEWRSIGERTGRADRCHNAFRSKVVVTGLLTFVGVAVVWLLTMIW